MDNKYMESIMSQQEAFNVLKNTKVMVTTVDQASKLQQKLFDCGYTWYTGDQNLRTENVSPFFMIGEKTFRDCTSMSEYEESSFRIINIDALFKMKIVEEPKFKVGDTILCDDGKERVVKSITFGTDVWHYHTGENEVWTEPCCSKKKEFPKEMKISNIHTEPISRTYYVATDECGDVFLFDTLPTRHIVLEKDRKIEKPNFWSCQGEEEKLWDEKKERITAVGHLLFSIWGVVADGMTWEDEPRPIKISVSYD